MEVNEIIRKNVRRIMTERGLKVQDLADLYPCTYQNIAGLLSEKSETRKENRGFGPKTFKRLLEILEVDERELIDPLPIKVGTEALSKLWQKVYAVGQGDLSDFIMEAADLATLAEQKGEKELLQTLQQQMVAIKKILQSK